MVDQPLAVRLLGHLLLKKALVDIRENLGDLLETRGLLLLLGGVDLGALASFAVSLVLRLLFGFARIEDSVELR